MAITAAQEFLDTAHYSADNYIFLVALRWQSGLVGTVLPIVFIDVTSGAQGSQWSLENSSQENMIRHCPEFPNSFWEAQNWILRFHLNVISLSKIRPVWQQDAWCPRNSVGPGLLGGDIQPFLEVLQKDHQPGTWYKVHYVLNCVSCKIHLLKSLNTHISEHNHVWRQGFCRRD